MKYVNIKIEKIFEQIGSNINGLNDNGVQNNLKKYGNNTIPKAKREGFLKSFFKQFGNPIIFILLFASLLCIFIKEYEDAIFIFCIVIFNSLLGSIQEYRAGKKAESLQKILSIKSIVLRNGKEILLDSSEIVKGDVVLLESGSKVPADMRIIDCTNLSVDESLLTGESLPVSKNSRIIKNAKIINDCKNMLFAGTIISTGRSRAIVTEVGSKTELGKIARSVLETNDTKTPLTHRMEKFTKDIAIITLFIAIILSIVLLFQGYLKADIFLFVVALSVSAIPEGLPVALTLALTIASNRMSKKNVLVKKLNAVESLGSCTVIACDKTGTLTINEQTAKVIVTKDLYEIEVPGIGYDFNDSFNTNDENVFELVKEGYINNEARLYEEEGTFKHSGDTIDTALLYLKAKTKMEDFEYKIVDRIFYESKNKYSAVLYKSSNKKQVTVKGSYETVIRFCKGNNVKYGKVNEDLASRGYRVIAFAKGDYSDDKLFEKNIKSLEFLGFVAFIDPIRENVKEAIEKCNDAGIKVIMITGDHPLTSFSIAKELNMLDDYNNVVTGEQISVELKKGKVSFDKFIKDKIVFSRVTPIQKLEIIEAYKRLGEYIAVTGDGVNDAPALKASNIGVAMGSGTDVAKETGSMIITNDNFMSLVSGVEEGRVAYSNVRKVIYLLLSTGAAEVLFFLGSILMKLPIPLIAIQILWLNLVTNGIQDIALAFEKQEPGIMKERPRDPKEKIFDRNLIEQTLISAITIALIVLFNWTYYQDIYSVETSRTYILLLMVFMQNVHVFNCRSEKTSAFKMKFSSNPTIIVGVILALLLHIGISYTTIGTFLKIQPISIMHIVLLFLNALPILFVMEIYKKIKYKNH